MAQTPSVIATSGPVGVVFGDLFQGRRNEPGHHQAQSLFDPEGNEHRGAGHRQERLILPGPRVDQKDHRPEQPE